MKKRAMMKKKFGDLSGFKDSGFAREADIADGQPSAFGGEMPQFTAVLFFSTTLCSQSLKWSATVSECMALGCSSCRNTAMMWHNVVFLNTCDREMEKRFKNILRK